MSDNEQPKKAAKFLADGLVVIDLETSAEPEDPNAWIIEIGLVDNQGQALLDTKVRPGVEVTPAVERITGLEESDLKSAPDFRQVYRRLKEQVRGKPLGAYGSEKDREALRRALERFHLPPLEVGEWVDIAEMYMRYRGEESFFSLEEACHHEGIPVNGAHHALNDARMTLALVKKISSANAK